MLKRERRRDNEDERVLPLINVVFLLLIFFMLSGRLSASDPFEITLPVSVSDATIERQDPIVFVGADGRLAFNGEIVDEAGLRAGVLAHVEKHGSEHLRLKADGGADASVVVGVMEQLRDAGVAHLQLLTLPVAAGGQR